MIEQVGEILLTDQYWDCNCREDYIHPRNEEKCQVCHCHRDDQPDARVEEVLTNLGPAGKLWESKMNVTLCNMVMIEDADTGRVLVQHRLPKATNPWCGLTFPGGHAEFGESVTESAVREIREETGLTISHPRMCGIVEWEVPQKTETSAWQDDIPGSKYIVFMFRTSSWQGELKSSAEGKMEWMTLDEMQAGQMAPHMEEYLRVMLEDNVSQAYGISGSGILNIIDDDPKL